MANPAKLQKIRDALAQLDPANPDHWTDDGLPKTSVVQKVASDQTVSRADIQLASPGFERPAGPVADGTPDPLAGLGDPPEHTGASASGPAADGGTNAANDPDTITDEAEARRAYDQNVLDAQNAITAAQFKIKDGNRELAEAQKALQAANIERNAAFPPLTAAENVKMHIASENEMRMARVGMRGAASQLDLAMRRSNSRGWRRPTRRFATTQTGAANV